MKSNPVHAGRRALTSVSVALVIALTLMNSAHNANAQTQPAEAKPADQKPDLGTYQTLYLNSVAEMHDANDMVTDLRNMLPKARVYYVESQNAVSLRGSADDIQLAQKILSDIDQPRKTYRLTYSITQTDSGKQLGTQKVALIVVDSAGKTVLKQGGRVPIITGTSDTGSTAQNSQVQYLDMGLDIADRPRRSLDARARQAARSGLARYSRQHASRGSRSRLRACSIAASSGVYYAASSLYAKRCRGPVVC
jgi:hypothetical protein